MKVIGKLLLASIAASFLLMGAIDMGAQAQNYPWCAIYSKADTHCGAHGQKRCTAVVAGETNCGFATYEQCMADVSGAGGFCMPNTQYVPARGRS